MSYTTTQESMRRSLDEMQRALKAAKPSAVVKGHSATCPNPRHEDRNPSGWIKVGEGGIVRFHCKGCGYHGDVFQVLATSRNKTCEDILTEIRERDEGKPAASHSEPSAPARKPARTWPTYEALRSAVDAAKRAQYHAIFEAAHHYENPDTGRTDLLILRYRKPPEQGKTKGKKEMCQFHQRPDGVWVEGKPAGKGPLYHRKENAGAESIVMVEGEGKVEALRVMGFAATCWPGGAKAVKLADFTPLDGVRRVTFWPDADDFGREAMKEAAAIVGQLPHPPEIAWIEPADLDLAESEDVVDLIRQCERAGVNAKEAITNAFANAKTSTLSDGLKDRFAAIIAGEWYSLGFGFPILDKLSKALLPQNVCILAGRPGSIKSFFVLRVLLHWFAEGVRFAYLGLEEDRTFVNWRLVAMLERNGNLLDDEWVKDHPGAAQDAYKRHRETLNRMNRSIWERPGEQVTLEWVTEWVRNRAREGYRVIVVDPLTVCRPAAKPWISDHVFVCAAEHALSTCNSSLLLVNHCTKGAQLLDMDSVAGGSAYQRLSQCILLLERHKPPKQATLMKPDVDLGRFQCDINETVHICKSRKGKGQGMSVGFIIDWEALDFAEQGVILKKGQ
ncbi:MAG TPA: AAA family ATPase [Sedimentisphaerales bacterium]|nr:AAA family ATPase [Sedimentisphaerales bacterium]